MPTDQLTVAVTGPTGDLGIALVSALERSRRVKRIIGMARRPFDPASAGWKKTEYRQGDVQDAASVRDAVKGSDVVVHLAFAILSASDATKAINVDGSRIVFEEAAKAGAERICYASSVAAYGFHQDNPDWLTEGVEPRGTPEHFYRAQKAEVEVGATAEMIARLPKTPAKLAWIHSVRKEVLMKTERARKELGWKPRYSSRRTLKELVAAHRADGAESQG